jgi:lysozyme
MGGSFPVDMRDRISVWLMLDEGMRNKVYRDTERYLTAGIGHLVVPSDKLDEGDRISDDRVRSLFDTDLDTAIHGAYSAIPSLATHPISVQEVIVQMTFNLGVAGLLGFALMLDALERKEYVRAADEMKSSKWYRQVGARAKRLEQTMRKAR